MCPPPPRIECAAASAPALETQSQETVSMLNERSAAFPQTRHDPEGQTLYPVPDCAGLILAFVVCLVCVEWFPSIVYASEADSCKTIAFFD